MGGGPAYGIKMMWLINKGNSPPKSSAFRSVILSNRFLIKQTLKWIYSWYFLARGPDEAKDSAVKTQPPDKTMPTFLTASSSEYPSWSIAIGVANLRIQR